MKNEDLRLGRKVRFRHGHTEYTGTIEAVSVRTTPFNVEVFIDIGFITRTGNSHGLSGIWESLTESFRYPA